MFCEEEKEWCNYTRYDEVLSKIHGKDVGSILVTNGTTVDGGYPFFLAAWADSKYTSIVLSSWTRTQRDGKIQKQHVGGEIVEF